MGIIVQVAAIAAITVIECVALAKGINGKALSIASALIGGIAGVGISCTGVI